MRDFYERFSFIVKDEKLYSSPAYHEVCTNYRRNHSNNDPLEMFAGAIEKGVADTVNHVFFRKMIDDIVKDAAIKSDGTWIDD